MVGMKYIFWFCFSRKQAQIFSAINKMTLFSVYLLNNKPVGFHI